MARWYDSIFKDQATADLWNPRIDEWRKKYFGERVYQTVSKLAVLDFDKLYRENIESGAVLVPCGHDDASVAAGGSIKDIQHILFQSSNGNLQFVASCKCGQLGGNYNIGRICPNCKTAVRTAFADEINIHAWLEIPETLPEFLHPVAYRVLSKWMGVAKRKAPILDSILNVDAELPIQFEKDGVIGQGMTYFRQNFWDIIRYVANSRKGAKQRDTQKVMQFLKTYEDRLFCRHIPILNQSLHVLTHSGSMTYSDDSSQYILQTCIELGNTVYQQRHQPTMNKNLLEQHIYCTYKSWIDYTNSVINDKIQGKTGFIRKCILGARLHCSARSVIVPIIDPHLPDEVELPWRMVVGLFKLEILNRLMMNYGLDANTALTYWHQAQTGIAPEAPDTPETRKVRVMMDAVNRCLEQLLHECPYKGFPIVMGRNPTLRHGETKQLPLAV